MGLREERCGGCGGVQSGRPREGQFEEKGSLGGSLTLVRTHAVGHPCGAQKELDGVLVILDTSGV